MIAEKYTKQVNLLLQALPYIANEEIFALKGGTAINLFERNMPRLSVDIDLTYLPIDTREVSLKNIHDALSRIKTNLEKSIPSLHVHTVPLVKDQGDVKLNCQLGNAQIKIEVNTIMRGHLLPVRFMQVHKKVQEQFGKFAAINVVSHAELYGGKILAALDRQHPRDLFDIKQLLYNDEFTEELQQGFIVALLSHYKPIHELLNPLFKNQKSAFETQFAGMTTIEFTYEEYENTRIILLDTLKKHLTKEQKEFIISIEDGNPTWDLFPNQHIKDFPAIRWKLYNIQKFKDEQPVKQAKDVELLKKVLSY